MPTPVPALKTDELLARLKDLIDSGVRNEIKLHGLHQDAKRLLKQYPDNGDAHMALGIIEKLEGHESASVRHHEAALNCGWTSERALNYVVTLDHFCHHDEALRHAQNVVNNDPLNLFALRAATRLAFTTGRYRLERDLLTEYAKRSPNEMTADLAKLNTDVNSLVLAAESLNLTDDLLAEIHRPLWDLLRPIGCGKDINIADLVIGDGDDCFISRTLRLPVSFEEAQALNWQWVERIAEQDEPWPIEKIIITLREAA